MDGKTIGLRIQEGRKALGLSQEALGDALGVSRQAVSKWEADSALPEIDKLISMSKMFGIGIGELLGVEDRSDSFGDVSDGGGSESTDSRVGSARAGETLSDEQTERLKEMAELYAEKYAEKLAENMPAPKHRGLKIALVLVAAVFVYTRLSGLQNSVQQLQYNMSHMESRFSNEIGSITGRVSMLLEEQNDILAEKTIETLAYDLKNKTVTIKVRGRLKEWNENTALKVQAASKEGAVYTADAYLDDKGNFTSDELTTAMAEDMTLSLRIEDGGGFQSATIAKDLSTSESDFDFDVIGSFANYRVNPGEFFEPAKGRFWSVSFSNYNVRISPISEIVEVGSAELCAYRNNERKPFWSVDFKDEVEASKANHAHFVSIEGGSIDDETMQDILIYAGDSVLLALNVTDAMGNVFHYPISAVRGTEDKLLRFDHNMMVFHDEEKLSWTPGAEIDDKYFEE